MFTLLHHDACLSQYRGFVSLHQNIPWQLTHVVALSSNVSVVTYFVWRFKCLSQRPIRRRLQFHIFLDFQFYRMRGRDQCNWIRSFILSIFASIIMLQIINILSISSLPDCFIFYYYFYYFYYFSYYYYFYYFYYFYFYRYYYYYYQCYFFYFYYYCYYYLIFIFYSLKAVVSLNSKPPRHLRMRWH